MKYIILSIFIVLNLSAQTKYSALSRFFAKTKIEKLRSTFGERGLKALNKLSVKYGKDAVGRLRYIKENFGSKGVELFLKYGEDAIKNKTAFKMVSKYNSKGYYLIKQYPNSLVYYNKYGDNFVVLADRYGSQRVIRILNEASKHNQDRNIMNFIDKYGKKAIEFIERNWGKLWVSAFVLSNQDEIINSTQTIANHSIDRISQTTTESIKNVSNSNLGLMIGLSIILAVFFKFGWDKIGNRKKNDDISQS